MIFQFLVLTILRAQKVIIFENGVMETLLSNDTYIEEGKKTTKISFSLEFDLTQQKNDNQSFFGSFDTENCETTQIKQNITEIVREKLKKRIGETILSMYFATRQRRDILVNDRMPDQLLYRYVHNYDKL